MAQDYSRIDNNHKELESKKRSEMFATPEDIKGKHDHGLMRKLVFRFHDDKDYHFVGRTLGIETKSRNEKYKMDSQKLINLLRKTNQQKPKMKRRERNA